MATYTVILSPASGGATSALFEPDARGHLPDSFTIPIPNVAPFWEHAELQFDPASMTLSGEITAPTGLAVFDLTRAFQVFTMDEVVTGTYQVMPFPVVPPVPAPSAPPLILLLLGLVLWRWLTA